MGRLCSGLLILCIAHNFIDITLSARNPEIHKPEIEWFDQLVYTDIYERDLTSTVLTQTTPNCELAHKVGAGIHHGKNTTIFFWECMRCTEGYLEDFVPLSMRDSQKVFLKVCSWDPCGAFCDKCDVTRPFGHRVGRQIKTKCTKCADLSYGVNELQDVKLHAKNPQGKSVYITGICTLRSMTGQQAVAYNSTSAEELLDTLFSLFSPDKHGITLVEKNPLHLLIILDHVLNQVTMEYISNMLPKKSLDRIDVVHRGNKYLERAIEKAMGGLSETLLHSVVLILFSSRIVAELRGFLALCIEETFTNIGNPQFNETKLALAAKGCYAVDNVLSRLLSTALALSKTQMDQPLEPPVFVTLNEAPRLAITVLRMFGAVE